MATTFLCLLRILFEFDCHCLFFHFISISFSCLLSVSIKHSHAWLMTDTDEYLPMHCWTIGPRPHQLNEWEFMEMNSTLSIVLMTNDAPIVWTVFGNWNRNDSNNIVKMMNYSSASKLNEMKWIDTTRISSVKRIGLSIYGLYLHQRPNRIFYIF